MIPANDDICRAAAELRWLEFCIFHFGDEELPADDIRRMAEAGARAERVLAAANLAGAKLLPINHNLET